MALIEPLDLSQYALAHDAFSFQQTFAGEFGGLDQDLLDLLAIDTGPALHDLSSIENYLTGDFENAALSLAAESADTSLNLIGTVHDSIPIAASAVDEARARVPDEGYQRIPEDLRPPPDLGGFTGAPAPAPTPGPISPGLPGDHGILQPIHITPQVQLSNQSRPGALDFTVGETFTLVVYGEPNQPVTVSSTHEDKPVAMTAMGSTDPLGYLNLKGKMSVGDVGYWIQTWRVAGEQAQPVLSFYVR